MNNKKTITAFSVPVKKLMLVFSSIVFMLSCHKNNIPDNDRRNFEQVNLVANSDEYHPVTIGLWAISFAPATARDIDPTRLYFTAGPDQERNGVFGYRLKK
jgi:hypothetical protein